MENKKPPIGIIPEKIRKEQRLKEIISAFERFINAQKEIPKEWIDEYNKLILELRKELEKYSHSFSVNISQNNNEEISGKYCSGWTDNGNKCKYHDLNKNGCWSCSYYRAFVDKNSSNEIFQRYTL